VEERIRENAGHFKDLVKGMLSRYRKESGHSGIVTAPRGSNYTLAIGNFSGLAKSGITYSRISMWAGGREFGCEFVRNKGWYQRNRTTRDHRKKYARMMR
jgi:hypothetical protein